MMGDGEDSFPSVSGGDGTGVASQYSSTQDGVASGGVGGGVCIGGGGGCRRGNPGNEAHFFGEGKGQSGALKGAVMWCARLSLVIGPSRASARRLLQYFEKVTWARRVVKRMCVQVSSWKRLVSMTVFGFLVCIRLFVRSGGMDGAFVRDCGGSWSDPVATVSVLPHSQCVLFVYMLYFGGWRLRGRPILLAAPFCLYNEEHEKGLC